MSTQQTTTDLPRGGQGRLARLIATRGGRAAPEEPFVIEHREALIYMLYEAAELEHGIMCQYLFAAFSLKQSVDEGLTEAQLAAAERWRRQVFHVATQEMLHLALVQNLLSAIGSAPHLSRPNFPASAGHYPAGVQLALIPFGERALRHFMFLERPEGMDLTDAQGLAAMGAALPHLDQRDIVPQGQDFATVSHLYRSIEAALAHLAAEHGEDWLFVGPPRAQATPDMFGWPELVAVTDLASAQRAIDEILEQGEGPRGDWRNAHFGQFVAILEDYLRLTATDPDFHPVRPAVAANVRPHGSDAGVPLIESALTARISDLFNVVYEILLQLFQRFFAHTEETDVQLKILADAAVGLMVRAIRPLGDLVTTQPVGDALPGRTAGPSFEVFYENDYLMPHREAAWALLAERIDEAATLGEDLRIGRGAAFADRLTPVVTALRDLSATLAEHLPPRVPQARLAARSTEVGPEDVSVPPPRQPQPAVQPEVKMPPPAPDQPLGFKADVRPLFRERDRQSMLFAFDLWSADDVSVHAAAILQRLQAGSMPCDRAWPPERVEVFRRWTDTGMPR
jgi:Ferritin-like